MIVINLGDECAFNGIWITDPYMDETGRFPVDPIEYYGVDPQKGDTNDDLR